MKDTTDGQVPDRCYYYLLDWRDSYIERFVDISGKEKVKELSTYEFWRMFDITTNYDKSISNNQATGK